MNLISSKIAKHVDVLKLFASIALRPVYTLVIGSLVRPCKPHVLDLTIATTWIRPSSEVRGDTHNSQIT